ncbi:MAG: hypothetical protein ACRC5S_03740 [Cetobacterium sp.]
MNLLKLKNELPENIYNLLNGLYAVPGAKDIFKKYGVEILNKEVEIEMIQKVKAELELFLSESKDVKEFNQVKQYVDMQISSNTSMLNSAEGFMKNMIEMNITTANNQLAMAISQFNTPVMEKAIELVKTLIISNVNKEDFLKGLSDKEVNLTNVIEKIEALSKENIIEIEARYTEVKEDSNKEEVNEKVEIKKNEELGTTTEVTEETVDGKKVKVEVTKGKIIPGTNLTETKTEEKNFNNAEGIDLLGGDDSDKKIGDPNNSSVFDLKLGDGDAKGKSADNLNELLTGLDIDFGDGLNF